MPRKVRKETQKLFAYCQRNQIENFFVIIEFMIEMNSPFRKGNQETTEETMEEFHRPKKMDIYIKKTN